MKKGQRRKENAQRNKPRRKRRNPAFESAHAFKVPPDGWVTPEILGAVVSALSNFIGSQLVTAEPLRAPDDIEVRELERLYKL